jgi:predicted ATPase
MAFHVNDYEIRWKNYRPFKDTGWIALRPLTILIGNNNSGKTSVISPLLLMAQTLASRDVVTPLVTRGPLIEAGTFKDILHNRDTSQTLFLGLRYHLHTPTDSTKPVGEYVPGAIEITLAAGDRPEDIRLRDFALYDIYKRPYIRHHYNSHDGGYTLTWGSNEEITLSERRAIMDSKPVNFLFSPTSVLRNYQRPTTENEESPSRQQSKGFNDYLGTLAYSFEELRDLFRHLVYVGPLREQPRPYYEIASEMPVSVGSHGEHMANVIRRRFSKNHRRLDKWIQRFEFGNSVHVDDLSDHLFALSFHGKTGSFAANIADAGFGASQVLPLIVQALTADEESLTIAEQPEIHLNPRLQSVLADLFVEMVNDDRRLVVETHSEHLLLRLRRLVADGTIAHNKVAIYFVEKDDGLSRITPIPLELNGHIEQWPRGFFEESLRESLALASAQSRKPAKLSTQ